MLELHMTNGETIHCKDASLKEVMKQINRQPVFVQVDDELAARTDDISFVWEVENDDQDSTKER